MFFRQSVRIRRCIARIMMKKTKKQISKQTIISILRTTETTPRGSLDLSRTNDTYITVDNGMKLGEVFQSETRLMHVLKQCI